ncbi:Uncharacterised protein [Mycobacterium tuberculosis]|nr:Uncharacterised protein [Mycobacterium tuberculosis]
MAEALLSEQPDQHRGQQDGHRHRYGNGDKDLPHGRTLPHVSSATNASATAPSPAAFEALTKTTSPGRSSARSSARAASPSATLTAVLQDRSVVHGADRPPGSHDNESRHI